MNNDTSMQDWFIIIISLYGYKRILPVPVRVKYMGACPHVVAAGN